MENGIQMTLEMWMPELFQGLNVGDSAHHVRISQSQESEQDLTETEVPSLEKYLESAGKLKKRIDPNGLSTRTLRVCLAQMGGQITLPSSWKWNNWGTISNGKISTQSITFPKTGSGSILSDTSEELESVIFSL